VLGLLLGLELGLLLRRGYAIGPHMIGIKARTILLWGQSPSPLWKVEGGKTNLPPFFLIKLKKNTFFLLYYGNIYYPVS